MIDAPLSPLAVFIAWRDPVAHRCYPVARLARLRETASDGSAGYEFAYVHGVRDAMQNGFKPITSFEEVDRVYRSEQLFPFLANRIMSKSRAEFAGFLERIMLGPGRASPLEMLSRTGGIRATDTYEIFPLPRFDPELPGFRTFFLAHALRHLPSTTHERIAKLQSGERLCLMIDCQNNYDPRAIALRTEDLVLVGHVPNYLLLEVYTLTCQCEYVDITVAKLSQLPAPLDQRLLCYLETCWPDDYKPFVDDRFQPLSQDAVPTVQLIAGPEQDLEFAGY